MEKSRVITWNTGRKYSANGQRVAAYILPDRRVAFVDVDRMVWGVTIDEIPVGYECLIMTFVMDKYDYGAYTAPDLRQEKDFNDFKMLEDSAKEI